MGFWFQGKKGSEAQGFGKSTKKSRKSRRSFMLEEIITPSALIPGVHDSESVAPVPRISTAARLEFRSYQFLKIRQQFGERSPQPSIDESNKQEVASAHLTRL